MLNKEQTFYLSVLRDFIHKQKTEKVDNLNWERLIQYSFAQNTNGILFYQCKDFIPEPYKQKCNQLYMAEIVNYGKRVHLTNTIENKLKDENIPYFIVKGLKASTYYPVFALRTMGDSDFIVLEKDKEKAFAIMEELGFHCDDHDNESAYLKNNVEVEIHTKLMYEEKENKQEEIDYFSSCWDYVLNNELNENYHYIFLLVHLKKHLINSGVGFRQFMDLALMEQKANLDFDWIDKEIEKLSLTHFKDTCMAFINRWFDLHINEELLELDDDFFEDTTNKIFMDGVFGHDNKENEMNNFFIEQKEKEDINLISRIKHFFRILFPSYTELVHNFGFRFIENRHYLVPVGWIYRYILAIKNNTVFKETKKLMNETTLSNKEFQKRKNRFDSWGI